MELDFEVVDLEESDHPEEGMQAPEFVRPLVNKEYWENVALSDLTARGPVLLVFYPMDGVSLAIYIWNELRDRAWDDDYDLTIVGASISSPYEHKTFINEREMSFQLFTDPQNGVAKKYGVVNNLDGMAGVSEPRPAVFLIDEERVIQYSWVAQEWPAFPNYNEIDDELASI